MQAPAFILVKPQMGENIGAAARGMLNFGLEHMRIVAPRDGWPNERAVAMASGAGRLLDDAMLTGTTEEATRDLTYLFATTGRPRGMVKEVFTPEAAMAKARALIAAGERVGVLFGGERAGLDTADIIRADAIVSVPVNPEFPSLNLAQCVLLCGYEWRRHAVPEEGEVLELLKHRLAETRERDAFVAMLFERLEERGFFWPEHKAQPMRENLENLFRRVPLTDADVRTLFGVVKYLAEREPGQERRGRG
ncbi:MAG: RNA methyltransferase [Rubricella sp.]